MTMTSIKKGQKIKFVVSSAEEAVKLIQQEMGPEAKVLSVRQVEGRGLAKFLTAPKLEIIAALPEEEAEAEAAQAAQSKKAKGLSLTDEEKALLEENPESASSASNIGGKNNGAEPKGFSPSFTHASLPGSFKTKTPLPSENRLESVLRSAGFENSLIQRFKTSTDWEKLQRVPVKTALADLARRLRIDCEAVQVPAATQMIVFIGGAGVGKTTALCKQLAHEVFFERRSVQVMKLDGETPNADTALNLYCEVMGVPLIRDAKMIEATSALLIDTSGVSLNDTAEVSALKARLDAMGAKTRAWVVNAAYDNSVIDRSLSSDEELGATHTVYTHLDEVATTSRLWHFILSGRLPALFGSTGPGIAHDRTTEIGAVLLQKTFPEYLFK